jgi:16S rRNA (guanine(527)-N(7))-methyltransferase RsmG
VTVQHFQPRLAARVEHAGLPALNAWLSANLETYYRLLALWNRKINLTALDLEGLPADAIDRLFVEPLAAATYVAQGGRVLDIGSGGGSPAIPFALASEASGLTMVESRARKSVFLREAARNVGISGGEVMNSRFEEMAELERFRGAFDVATIRAVRLEADDWRRLGALIRPSGTVLLLEQAGLDRLEPPQFRVAGSHRLTDKAQLSIFMPLDRST